MTAWPTVLLCCRQQHRQAEEFSHSYCAKLDLEMIDIQGKGRNRQTDRQCASVCRRRWKRWARQADRPTDRPTPGRDFANLQSVPCAIVNHFGSSQIISQSSKSDKYWESQSFSQSGKHRRSSVQVAAIVILESTTTNCHCSKGEDAINLTTTATIKHRAGHKGKNRKKKK